MVEFRGKKYFATLIRKNHEKGGKAFVVGKIMGIEYMTCKAFNLMNESYEEITHVLRNDDLGDVVLSQCTADQYMMFAEVVDHLYPGLCIFNFDIEGGLETD